jgi:hypothetical protein
MGTPLSLLIASGLVTLVLIGLFRHERARGVRYGARIRGVFDRIVTHIHMRFVQSSLRVSGRTIRQTVHYLFHQLLAALLRVVSGAESRIRAIMHLNKKRANRPEKPASHLAAINEHKRASKLSEDEARVKKEDALDGR